MILEWKGHSAFLKQRHINALCKRARVKSASLKEWVRLLSTPSILPVVGTRLDQFLELGIRLEEAEATLVKRLEGGRRLVGVRCADCILVHPGPFGREVLKLLRKGTLGLKL